MSDEAWREAEYAARREIPGTSLDALAVRTGYRRGFAAGAQWQAARDRERIEALEAEVAEYRRHKAASTSQYGYQEPEYGTVWVPCETADEAATYGQPGDALVRRLVGPWEAVGDDD